MKVRRVVTGHKPDGKATIASDTKVEGITLDIVPGWEFHRLWGADETVTFPDDGSPRTYSAYFPPVRGFRFGLFTVPPRSETGPEDIDFEYIISGEVWLELDDGEEVHLRAGDTVVQNGTRHAWHNKSSEPCRIVVCLIGAHRS